ncbi:hypothetical protein JTB14_016839 [Gonioctena quinquepunctata]|nr:hypothetical protein JTB14_016839 [Gonioctena quinquepunctata]
MSSNNQKQSTTQRMIQGQCSVMLFIWKPYGRAFLGRIDFLGAMTIDLTNYCDSFATGSVYIVMCTLDEQSRTWDTPSKLLFALKNPTAACSEKPTSPAVPVSSRFGFVYLNVYFGSNLRFPPYFALLQT